MQQLHKSNTNTLTLLVVIWPVITGRTTTNSIATTTLQG
jgi:hypothetical protein